MEINIRGEEFLLTPEHCLFWPRKKLLAVADIHLGKAEAFRRNGLFIPGATNSQDLEKLSQLVQGHQAEHLVFLGDFVHTVLSVGPELVGVFAEWRQKFAGKVTVLLGNHDRGLDRAWPTAWNDTVRGAELSLDGFTFQHEPPAAGELTEDFIWAGHVHPVVRLSGGVDSVRLPCYFVAETFGLLPAFSSLAGGFNVKPGKNQRAFVVAGREVREVGPAALGKPA